MKIGKLIVFMLLMIPAVATAQNITIGTCNTKDGATYHGEMLGNKPHGKGTAKYQNGDVYVGEYVK